MVSPKLETIPDEGGGKSKGGKGKKLWKNLMRKSKKCKTFVSDTGNGLPSTEEVNLFVEAIFCNPKKEKKKIPTKEGPNDDGSSDDDSEEESEYDYTGMYR